MRDDWPAFAWDQRWTILAVVLIALLFPTLRWLRRRRENRAERRRLATMHDIKRIGRRRRA